MTGFSQELLSDSLKKELPVCRIEKPSHGFTRLQEHRFVILYEICEESKLLEILSGTVI